VALETTAANPRAAHLRPRAARPRPRGARPRAHAGPHAAARSCTGQRV